MTARQKPRRGEIWLVNFEPTVGPEIRKTRPALILQNDTANQYSPVTIVAALSSQVSEDLYPTEVLIPAGEGGLPKASLVLLNQLRTIDKQRLVKKMGTIHAETMLRVEQALMISLGLVGHN
jgi:mRNA interferase MazF